MGRGHVSLSIKSDTWHSELIRDIGYLRIFPPTNDTPAMPRRGQSLRMLQSTRCQRFTRCQRLYLFATVYLFAIYLFATVYLFVTVHPPRQFTCQDASKLRPSAMSDSRRRSSRPTCTCRRARVSKLALRTRDVMLEGVASLVSQGRRAPRCGTRRAA